MRSPILLLGLISCVGLFVGCGEATQTSDNVPQAEVSTATPQTQAEPLNAPLNIMVSVLPQKYFVEQIGGDRVNVSVMVGAGIQPENYEPKPQQLKDLSQADAYIAIGIFFEDVWGDRLKAANKEMQWLDSSTGVEKIVLADHHHHEGEAAHSHDEDLPDPHIWLSPQRVKQQAESIYQLLVKLDPQNEKLYADNLNKFLKEIEQVDQAIREKLTPLKQRSFLIFHPSLGYFAKDYNLEQIAIEVEGQEPSAAELAEIVKIAQEKQIKVIFAEPQDNTQSVAAIAQEIGAQIITIDHLNPNWSENLVAIAAQFANKP